MYLKCDHGKLHPINPPPPPSPLFFILRTLVLSISVCIGFPRLMMELTTLWMNEASLQTIFHRLMACCTQLLYDEVEEGRSQKGTFPGIAPHEKHF